MNKKNTVVNEKRQYVRLTTHNIVRCEKYVLKDAGLYKKLNTITKNVSAGGVLFGSKEKYEIGDVVKLEIDFPGWEKCKNEFYQLDQVSKSKPIIILGSVVRIEAVQEGRMFDIGVCFAGIDKGHQKALNNHLRDGENEK